MVIGFFWQTVFLLVFYNFHIPILTSQNNWYIKNEWVMFFRQSSLFLFFLYNYIFEWLFFTPSLRSTSACWLGI